jgi:hypothetical protein
MCSDRTRCVCRLQSRQWGRLIWSAFLHADEVSQAPTRAKLAWAQALCWCTQLPQQQLQAHLHPALQLFC